MDARAEFAWQVPVDHPAFAGHFPGRPIVPGVVLLDRALLFAEKWLQTPVDRWQVGQTKFLSPVGPGEALSFRFERSARGGLNFTVAAADRPVASGSLTPPAP